MHGKEAEESLFHLPRHHLQELHSSLQGPLGRFLPIYTGTLALPSKGQRQAEGRAS